MLDLELFCRLAAAREVAWTALGATARLDRSPEDGRTKAAAWLSIDLGAIGGQLCVWDSGEGELEVYPDPPSEATLRHFDDLTDQDIPDLLATLDGLLRRSANG